MDDELNNSQPPGELARRSKFWTWRKRHTIAIGRVGWTLFLSGLGIGIFARPVADILRMWFGVSIDSRNVELITQIASAVMFAGIACAFLTVSSTTELPKPTSDRLKAVIERFSGLDVLIKELSADVQKMTVDAVVLEQQKKEALAIINMPPDAQQGLIRHWERENKKSARRDILLFAAGLAAGVLTNLLIP